MYEIANSSHCDTLVGSLKTGVGSLEGERHALLLDGDSSMRVTSDVLATFSPVTSSMEAINCVPMDL